MLGVWNADDTRRRQAALKGFRLRSGRGFFICLESRTNSWIARRPWPQIVRYDKTGEK